MLLPAPRDSHQHERRSGPHHATPNKNCGLFFAACPVFGCCGCHPDVSTEDQMSQRADSGGAERAEGDGNGQKEQDKNEGEESGDCAASKDGKGADEEATDESIRVVIRYADGERNEVRMRGRGTIGEMREKVEESRGTPREHQRLYVSAGGAWTGPGERGEIRGGGRE